MKRNLLVVLGLAVLASVAAPHPQESVLDRIERSIPERDTGWRIVKDGAYLRTEIDDFPQAAFTWTNDVEKVSAYQARNTPLAHRG
jgi:hypothetical protein